MHLQVEPWNYEIIDDSLIDFAKHTHNSLPQTLRLVIFRLEELIAF